MKKGRGLLFLPLVLFLAILFLVPNESLGQKFLTKPIEFVCHAAAGGGSDIMARMMQSIIVKEKLFTHTIAVVNRPGGGGAIAFAYVAGKKGDPHFWLTATTSFLTTPLLGKSKYTYKDFTPLVNLAYDDFFVTVKADSPYKTMKDLIADAKKRPGQINTGGTYAPGTDALISHMIEKAAGVKFNYIPFKSGGEAMVALLGGNLDMFYPNPGEALAQVEAKKVRILAVASEKRMAAVPDIPTLRELGINATFQQVRSIAAPKDLAPEAIRFYEELFRKLAESKMWKEKYIQENMLTWDYKNSAETGKLWEANNEACTRVMKEMGAIK
ncbi:MAG: tripartite tricarboxylate transporter substrate binding protein [Deltaproteobacteria bacterium]|nr:tripartite tricarboxylate transporter substrate binding protein [Deltaproteobacteria bacterium]